MNCEIITTLAKWWLFINLNLCSNFLKMNNCLFINLWHVSTLSRHIRYVTLHSGILNKNVCRKNNFVWSFQKQIKFYDLNFSTCRNCCIKLWKLIFRVFITWYFWSIIFFERAEKKHCNKPVVSININLVSMKKI